MSPRRGYSLLELIVVIAIIGLLTALLLAAAQKVRLAAVRADCQDQLRQQGLAVFGYESAHGRLPPGAVQGPCDPPLNAPSGVSYGLWPLLLGHLDRADLAARYRLDRPFDASENWPAIAARRAEPPRWGTARCSPGWPITARSR